MDSIQQPHSAADILIVEDSPTQAEKLRALLARNGYRARVAVNGDRAMEAIRERGPDLVLSDVIMPGMDGFALCRLIKTSSGMQDIPVILVTSLIDPRDIVRGLECGADSFIRKPYADGYLLSRIEHVLVNRQLRQEENSDSGVALYLGGQKHVIHAERQQILDLLVSTYEQAVFVNDELRQREREVNELNARLAQHAAQLEVTNAEIAHKNVELERASRMKSEFLANMSHELRTPLNAIIGFSEAMKHGLMGQLTDQQVEHIGDIYDSGQHLLSLINDILDLSKVEAGKMDLELEPTDLQRLLQGTLTLFRERAQAGKVNLRLEMEALGSVLTDPRKTRQILYNLLSNAIKFTPEGGAVVLRMFRVDQPDFTGLHRVGDGQPQDRGHGFLEISVTDSGIGIAEEDLRRLFQPFVQLDSGRARKYEGTGLGLALTRQLVELHGGVMAVRSEPGRGSEFAAWLPYMEPHAGKDEAWPRS